MKIRTDFVTNSSSASFFLTLCAPAGWTKESVAEWLWSNCSYSGGVVEVLNSDIQALATMADRPNIFTISEYLFMYNGMEDLSEGFRNVIRKTKEGIHPIVMGSYEVQGD